METKDDIKRELDELAPFLGGLPKSDLFKVDESYFDTLPTAVMDAVHARTRRKTGIDLSWLLRPRFAVSMAVGLIALIAGSFILLKQPAADKPMPIAKVQQLLNEPVTADNVIDNVSDDDLADALASAETKPIHKDIEKRIKAKKTVDKKAIEDYILDNVDASSIIDQL